MASKSKRRRKVLGASCILAALIIAGSSFAWFTSKDEVTNRLSASANYGVTIAEDFTPPENWVPGQEINKDVGVVNTGNVDAFTRVWLEGEMNVLNKKTSTVAASAVPTGTTETTDPDLLKLGLKYYDATNKQYFKLLSTKETLNPNDSGDSSQNADGVNDNKYSEVKAVQAGGWLVYAPANVTGASPQAAFKFTPEQEYTYTNATANTGSTTVAANTEVTSDLIADTWSFGGSNVGLAIDSDTFTPQVTGLYIFRRTINEKSSTTGYDYEYSGYFFDATNSEYYALEYKTSDNSDYVIDPTLLTIAYSNANDTTSPVIGVTPGSIKLFTAAYTELKNSDLKWVYTAPTTSPNKPATLTAIYAGADDKYKTQEEAGVKTDYSADDIAVVVTLGDVAGTTNETWTPIMDTGSAFTYYTSTTDTNETSVTADQKVTFYYKNDVEEGDTTAKLVDSVLLSSDTKKEAFLAFDFDLNVKMDSIQVTKDADGNETFDTVSGGWTSTNSNVTAAKASDTVGAPEINSITWQKN